MAIDGSSSGEQFVYDDRLAGRITDELWVRKSAEWETELSAIRRETARHERASHDYAATGSKILVEGNETGNWLGGRDSNPDKRSQSPLSYR